MALDWGRAVYFWVPSPNAQVAPIGFAAHHSYQSYVGLHAWNQSSWHFENTSAHQQQKLTATAALGIQAAAEDQPAAEDDGHEKDPIVRAAHWKLRNAKMLKPTRPRFRLRNAKYQPPPRLFQLDRTSTWDKSPLHGDISMQQVLGSVDMNIWKISEEDGVSEAETQQISDAHSSASEDDVDRVLLRGKKECAQLSYRLPCLQGEAKFEGKWRQATIRHTVLTWNEGEEVPISILTSTSFRMTYIGCVYTAELQEDGTLLWDDGDVWHRKIDAAEMAAKELPPWLSKRRFRDHAAAKRCAATRCDCKEMKPETVEQTEVLPTSLPPWRRRLCIQEDKAELRKVATQPSQQSAPTHAKQVITIPQQTGRERSAEQAAPDSSFDRRQTVAMLPLTPISENIYKGIIKFFKGSYGWISCKALEAEYPDCDIMVHKNDCHHFECNFSGKPKQGNLVSFRLALNAQGDPQAVDVKSRRV